MQCATVAKRQESRSPKTDTSEISKLTRAVFDMKAKIGIMLRVMTNAGISFDHVPNQRKTKEQAVIGKQRGESAGVPKKQNKPDKVAQRSHVHVSGK